MLTGRPPFPGGTVLQKLIQHQEEPPADVRTFNPAVPVELAAVIARLMAKDRDRRYPDARNIWCATCWVSRARLGWRRRRRPCPRGWTRRIGPRGSFIWSGWSRCWVSCWWSRALPGGDESRRPRSILTVQRPRGPTRGPAVAPGGRGVKSPEPVITAPVYPRNIPVSSSNDDLLEVLATAPRRSVIILSDDGPYLLGGRKWIVTRTGSPGQSRSLDQGRAGDSSPDQVRRSSGRGDQPLTSLLHFVGGRVAIEGLKFELDAVLPEDLLTAIKVEDTELTVRGCSFRRTNSREGRNVAAIQVRTLHPAAAPGDRPPAVLADTCHFDGGQTGILAEGPVDLVLAIARWGPASRRSGLTTRGRAFRSRPS